MTDDTDNTGKLGVRLVVEYLSQDKNAQIELVDFDPNQEFESQFQLRCGDVRLTTKRGIYNIEIKTECSDKFGNLFIETWSDRRNKRRGWLYNLTECHGLFYVFLKQRITYVMNFEKLRHFDLTPYDEKPQMMHPQDNETWGHPVPIEDLLAAGVIVLVIKKTSPEDAPVPVFESTHNHGDPKYTPRDCSWRKLDD